MKTTTALHALASSAALALSLGLATAAQAGDFDFGHPELSAQPARQAVARPAALSVQTVLITAQALQRTERTDRTDRSVAGSVSTEASRAMLGEDSGSFWMAQQASQPEATRVAASEAIKR